MAETASLTRVRGLSHSIPMISKVALSPGPMPRIALPPDSSLIAPMLEAVTATFRVYGLVTPVPSLTLLVSRETTAS